MASNSCKTCSLLLLAFLCCCSAASAFNITRMLNQFPEFGTFNNLLTQTQLAGEINRRATLTVLAVDNPTVSALSAQPLDVVKKVLSIHVVLDYYDFAKLHALKRQRTILTTLFQSSGIANDQMGFLNLSRTPSGIMLGSAMPGAPLTAHLVKSVAAQPYNISVFQISGLIVPSGIENVDWTLMKSPLPSPAAPPAAAPTSPSPSVEAPAPAPDASSPDADSPDVGSPPAPSAPAEAPDADAPAADAPAPSSDASPSPDVAADEAPAPSVPSSGSRLASATGLVSFMGAAVLAAL